MKLKHVKILGFKTFADKTEFDLAGDIIAVVGPNGCGKSNIVDSILWGLGESNARQLRAQTSKEVIFSGSTHRKPIGFCEVSLLFDNEDGALPIDSAEVSITRRLTRSGDSDYQINRRSCRLRDVNDLLADSGLGRAGYAIVGQSEIDQALAASAIQRRGWIDEAAGVQRYRARRTEALRRLASAEDHLTRVHDIINEIEHQREPLAEEAEAAKQYRIAVSSLREVESGLLCQELASHVADLADIQVRVAESLKTAEAELARSQELEEHAVRMSATVERLEARIEELRTAQQQAQTALEQANAAYQIAEHKLASLDQLESSIHEESGSSEVRRSQAEADLAKAKEEAEAEIHAHTLLHSELGSIDGEAAALDADLKRLEEALAKGRELVSKQQRIEVEMAHRELRLAQIQAEIDGIVSTIPDLEAGISEAELAFGELDGQATIWEEQKRNAEKLLTEIRTEHETQSADLRKVLAEIAVLDGRRKGLEATIDAHDGLTQGTRAVLAAVEAGRIQGEYVPVGSAIEVDSDLAQAFDTALGNAANDLIVPDESFAKRAIEFLKSNRLGRATFQPINLMRPPHRSPELRNLLKEKGVVGLASELADADPKFRPVIDSLLGRVVITETLDDSLRLARTSGWSRMVTLDGEVVHSSGAVTGGAAARQGTGIVQRRAELHELEVQIEGLQRQLTDRQSKDNDRETRIAAATKERDEATVALNEQSQDLEEARAWLLNLKHEMVATLRSKEKLTHESEQLREIESVSLEAVDIKTLESSRDDALRKLAERTSDAGNVQIRLEEASQRREQAAARLTDAERRLSHLLEAETARSRRAENLGPERERNLSLMEEAKATKAENEQRASDLREDLKLAMESRRLVQIESMRLARDAKEGQRIAGVMSEQAHQHELKRARLESHRANVVQRLLEEYGMGEDEAIAHAPTVQIPEDSSAVVARLRREIKAMGEVNLGAIEAYERLTTRYDELTHQVEDILGGKAEVENSVRELDRLTKDRFQATFEKLQTTFATMFQRIFGGGEGSLELTDAANILDSGVDIQVTIPGKRRQRLELLSGGERAMSALAFLFSLLEVKPTPLVILDEVDAPLDGRNVERFIQVMRDFSSKTQFILITHNPVTIESADVWFGVTMQEPGVSTLIPFKVPERSLIKAVVPDAYLKG